jgi:hypothetical protein
MPRTNELAVEEVFDTSLATESLAAWVEVANELVDDIAEEDPSLKQSRLRTLEKLVAAHLAAAQDQRAASQSGGARSVSFQGETGMGFEATKHGQAALSLDPTGTLASSHKPSASVSVPDIK